MEMPTDIRFDIPIPEGRTSPYGAISQMVEFLLERNPGESWKCDSGDTSPYRASKKAGLKIKRRKLPDGSGWVYWRVK